jgi:hypothetical protein
MTPDFFRLHRVAYLELCFLTSAAVGFPVSIFWVGPAGPGRPGTEYQVMPWDDEGPGVEFWDWYAAERPQLFATPEAAAAAFVLEWRRRGRQAG